ncbi:MAG: glutathione peroxidase [Planctomycetota bacterium]|nr:glutathione peroxidase [Planctomycetota bacterium]
MRRTIVTVLGVGALSLGSLALAGWSAAQPKAEPAKPQPEPAAPKESGVLDHVVKDIDGKDVDLRQFKGKVLMIVNVASRCGFTSQYEGLEKLYREKKDAGFVILGFPANNFGGQEPGTNEEIKEFCTSTYGVSFPMFAKISVKGEDQHPLYKALAAAPAPVGAEPRWNFTKFVLDRSGAPVARFDSRTGPGDTKLVDMIDQLLKSDQPADKKPAGKP